MAQVTENNLPQGDEKYRANVAELVPTADLDAQAPTPGFQGPREDVFAWFQVLGAFCLNLNTWGMMNTYGVFQTFYETEFLRAQSSSNIAWIGSTQAFLLFLISIISGPIFDAGYLRPLLCIGSVLVVIGMFLLSITSQYWQVLLTQALCMGLGFGCLYLPAPAIISQYFHTKIALAMGISSAGSALGGVVYPLIFTRLEKSLGFGWATRVLGFVLLGTSIISAGLMKTRSAPGSARHIIDRSAFRDGPYLLLNLGLLFGFMGLYIGFNYIELLALDRTDISSNLASYVLVTINLSSLLGRIIPGYYADKIGSINMQTSVALLSAILTFCLMALHTKVGILIFCILYGFFAGAFMGLPAAGVVNLSADKSKIGARLGMTLAFVGTGVLVSNPIAGAILGSSKNWNGLIGWCGALLLASSVSLAIARIAKVGPGWNKAI